MKEGLKLEFEADPPSSYEEENNRSAREHMEDLNKTVRKWEAEGACVALEHKPLFVNPMSVSVERDDFNNIKKKRPCIDLSRCIFNFKFFNILKIYIALSKILYLLIISGVSIST
jgi:hypothetical protein